MPPDKGSQCKLACREKTKKNIPSAHQECSEVKVIQLCLDSLGPHALHSPWISPGQNTGVGAAPLSRGSSLPRD